MPAKVRYEINEDEIETIESNADRIVGLLKDIDIDSVDLQHAARDIWAGKAISVTGFLYGENKIGSYSPVPLGPTGHLQHHAIVTWKSIYALNQHY